MSVYESLCLRSPISAARARPTAARVRGQIASDHCRSDLITGRTHWARRGTPFLKLINWAERSEASVIEQTLRLSRDVCMFVSKDRPLSWSRRRAHCGEMMHAHARSFAAFAASPCMFTISALWQECGSSLIPAECAAVARSKVTWNNEREVKMSLFRWFNRNDGPGHGMNRSPKQSDLKEKSKCLCSVGFNTTMDLAMGWTAAGSRWRRAFDSSRQPLLGLPTDVSLARFTIFSSVPASFDRLGFDCLRLEQIRVASSKFRSALIPQNFSTLWCTALTDPAGKRRLSSILQRRLSRILCVQSSSADWCSLAEELAGVLLCEVCNLTVGWTRRKRQRFFAGENKTGDAAR